MRFEEIKRILLKVKKEGRAVLDLIESRKVLELLGVQLNKAGLAESPEMAVTVARGIGFPVAMKIVSPEIIHKTEAGGVILSVNDENGVKIGFERIIENARRYSPDANIKGILVEEMIFGNELIVGTVKDNVFGDLIMFGIGGVLVELYKDVTFRLVPIKKIDAFEMMEEIKAKEILNGYRNSPPVDRNKLTEIMLSVSLLVEELTEFQSIEINPLVITNRGLVAIDARVIIG